MADDLFPFRDGDLWGFKNGAGQVVIPAQYEEAGSFSEGLARVQVQGKWGFVNVSGEMVIAPRFDQARFFQNGQAKVQEGAKWGYVDVTGRFGEQIDAATFVDKAGTFISEQDYRNWGKPPRADE